MRDIEAEVARPFKTGTGLRCLRQAQRSPILLKPFLNSRKLEQGMISPIEYQTANERLPRGKADRLNAPFQYLIKRSVVRYYNGTVQSAISSSSNDPAHQVAMGRSDFQNIITYL